LRAGRYIQLKRVALIALHPNFRDIDNIIQHGKPVVNKKFYPPLDRGIIK
jgi:hypothetical protein